MQVKTLYECDTDYFESYDIEVNGKTRVSVGTPEPEDCILCRDLNFAYSIVTLMREAWEAGKRGEEFIVENTEVNEND